MRPLLIIISLSFCASLAQAQSTRIKSLGLSQVVDDYNARLVDGDAVVFDSSLSFFTRLSFQSAIANKWSVSIGLTNGFRQNTTVNEVYHPKIYSTAVDLGVLWHLRSNADIQKDPFFKPFISMGYQQEYLHGLENDLVDEWIFHSQYGVGADLRLFHRTSLQLQALINQKLGDDFNTHLQYRAGLFFQLHKPSRYKSDDVVFEQNNDLKVQQFTDREIVRFDSLKGSDNHNFILLKTKSERDSIKLVNDELLRVVDSLQQIIATQNSPQEFILKPDSGYVGYYVVALSTSELDKAKARFEKLDDLGYKNLRVMPHKNGFNRVAIRAGKSKEKAQELLSEVQERCCRGAWLLYKAE